MQLHDIKLLKKLIIAKKATVFPLTAPSFKFLQLLKKKSHLK